MTDLMLPSENAWNIALKQGQQLIRSGFLPTTINTPEKFLAIVMKGRELGIPPMQACAHIHIINGKPTMSAELMLAQILKLHPKTKISYPTRTGEECVIKVQREGSEPSVFTFTMKDAQAAGLLGNPTWKKYPRAMLHARCVSEMARSLFPDAIAGISYTPEELGAQVNEDGEVIDVEANPAPTSKTLPAESEPGDHVAAASTQVLFFNKSNSEHIKGLVRFLDTVKGGKFLMPMCQQLEGKPYTKETVEEAWAKINPEAPDTPPE